MSERVSLKHRFQYVVFMAFCWLVRLLPAWLVWRIASVLARIGYILDGPHRRLALANLDIAFGDTKSAAEKRAIARGSFRNLFLTFAELVRARFFIPDIKSVARAPNIRRIGRAMKKGRGVIFLISHFGNWEIMAHRCVAEGYKLVSVARPIANPLIYDEINRLRALNGAEILRKKWVAREIIDRLKSDWCVAMLIDQYAGRFAPFAPFFGRKVSTTPAIALLAMKTGATVLPVFDVRTGYGKHLIYVCNPIEMPSTGDMEADILEGCARCNRILERWVRRHPDHWLWMARRWRRKKEAWEP